jgi:hypothetical protein
LNTLSLLVAAVAIPIMAQVVEQAVLELAQV